MHKWRRSHAVALRGRTRHDCNEPVPPNLGEPVCESHPDHDLLPSRAMEMRRRGDSWHCGGVTKARPRVRAEEPTTGHPSELGSFDFACAYGVEIPIDGHRTSEQWARAVWERAPAPLRWFMVSGWRIVLGLRLGPRGAPDHILGWRIVESGPDETVCQLRSAFLHASNSFRCVDGRLVFSTFVSYDRPIGRYIWLPVSLLHRPVARAALVRAARMGTGSAP